MQHHTAQQCLTQGTMPNSNRPFSRPLLAPFAMCCARDAPAASVLRTPLPPPAAATALAFSPSLLVNFRVFVAPPSSHGDRAYRSNYHHQPATAPPPSPNLLQLLPNAQSSGRIMIGMQSKYEMISAPRTFCRRKLHCLGMFLHENASLHPALPALVLQTCTGWRSTRIPSSNSISNSHLALKA